MHWWPSLAIPLCAVNAALVVYAHEQVPLSNSRDSRLEVHDGRPWDEPPHPDSTGNLIFQSLAMLTQLGPNSKYMNGHSIARASIPAGTLLYHGRATNEMPTRDWIAFDPEHSHVFAAGVNGTLFTFATTRDLRLVFFDGCSGNKFDGVVDTQDVLFWGEVGYDPHDQWFGELSRFQKMCEWGRQYGLDGIVRMQLDFEIMYCDVANGGLELVSAAPLVANEGVKGPTPQKDVKGTQHVVPPPSSKPPIHFEPMVPPEGWKGSLPSSWAEAKHTGAWHNEGEGRIRVDPSSMISFYDPALTSLVEARRSMQRDDYRLTGISKQDVARAQADVADMLTRHPSERSGVDWQGLAGVIQDRFSDRLPFARHLAHKSYTNATEQAVAVRREVLISLLPYMSRDRVGTPEWYAHMADACATRYTSHLPISKFTKQEHVLYNATREVLHEICRVYTDVWRGAFDIEEQSVEVAAQRLNKWRDDFDGLVEWLDWPVWMGCHPSCNVDEFCSWPQRMFWESDPNPQPHCVPLGRNAM